MFKHTIKKLPKNTHEILVTIPWTTIQAEYVKAFDKLHIGLEMEGFRKGKVPKPMAEKAIAKQKVYEQLIRDYIPSVYEEIVKTESLKPIVSPEIDLSKAEENKDWEIKITVAEKPEVVLGEYKKKIKEVKEKEKKPDIWVPGKEEVKKEPNEEVSNQKYLNQILTVLIETIKCEVSDLVIEKELNGRLTRLVDDVQKIGLTVESYLRSKNTTMDKVKAQYRREIDDMYKLEFILLEIADKESIKVEKADLDKLFAGIKEEKERKMAEDNAYMYASVLRKQKTIDYLTSL
ncbi:MAG: trigger factor [bacterium]|nr:trigger factor [bacterium]